MKEYKHILFLSHSGADTEAAWTLVDRIESSPYAQEHLIRVWFDNRDLESGHKWRPQIEDAIDKESTAFAVYVGSHGIINWVANEVDLGLSKATKNNKATPDESNYPFIPILTKKAQGSKSLPPFTRQYQAIRNVEGDQEQFKALLLAITGENRRSNVALVDKPFMGLRSFGASDSHLFFGHKYKKKITRSNGTKFKSKLGNIGELLYRLEEHRLLMVYGDSGSGKSSLVKAGLIPHYRGGGLADSSLNDPDDSVWFVIETRPLRDPYDQLAERLARILKSAGSSAKDQFAVRDRVKAAKRQGDSPAEPEKVLDAFGFVSPENARVLLVVDQFEELFTQVKDSKLREDFISLLVYLANEDSELNVRIVLTMRRDYYNLCAKYEQFYSLTQDSKYLVRRMKDKRLRECIIKPLELAGVEDTEVFAKTVLRDVGDRPGDLALMEMALSDTWRNRASYDNDLLRTYQALGEVTGVLANRADKIYNKLNAEERSQCAGIFIRLVQLGTGGATRRTAYRNEFTDQQWHLIQQFASEEFGRLIVVVGDDDETDSYAELTHEALYNQWEQYQLWLKDVDEYKSILDKVTERARLWEESPAECKEDYLLAGYELGQAKAALDSHGELLSDQETYLITLSSNKASEVEKEAEKILHQSIKNESRALAALAVSLINPNEHKLASKMLLAAWPRDDKDRIRPQLAKVVESAYKIIRIKNKRVGDPMTHQNQVYGSQWNEAETQILSWSRDGSIRLWDAQTQTLVGEMNHEGQVYGAQWNQSETQILSWSRDGSIRLWDAQTQTLIGEPMKHQAWVIGAQWNQSETQILSWSSDNSIHLWDAQTQTLIGEPMKHEERVTGAQWNQSETQILSWSRDGSIQLWDAQTQTLVGEMNHEGQVYGAQWNQSETQILSWSRDGSTRLWDTQTQTLIREPMNHEGEVYAAVWNQNETQILSWSRDGSIRLWDAQTQTLIGEPMSHEERVTGAQWNQSETQILSLSFEGSIRLWDAQTQTLIGEPMKHEERVTGAQWNQSETQILSWSDDNSIRLWDAQTQTLIGEPMSHEERVTGAQWNQSETQILSWSSDGSIRLWDVANSQILSGDPTMTHEGFVNGVRGNEAETQILSWSGDGSIRLWDAQTQTLVGEMSHEGRLLGAQWNQSETQILSLSFEGSIRLWDAQTQTLVGEMNHDSFVHGAQWNQSGTQILSWSSDNSIHLWDAQTQALVGEMNHEGGMVYGAVWNQSETQILSWSSDNSIHLWDAQTQTFIGEPMSHEERVTGAQWNQSETQILSWSDGNSIRLWDAQTQTLIGEPMKHQAWVIGAQWNQSETQILSWSGDGSIQLWDAQTQTLIGEPMKHEERVTGAQWNQSGTQILSWSDDNSIRLWDAQTQTLIGEPMSHEERVTGAQWNQSETQILSWSSDGSIRLWDTQTQTLIREPMNHEGEVYAAVWNQNETQILSWTVYGVHLWDAKFNGKNWALQELCNRLQGDHDFSEIKDRFGITVSEDICQSPIPYDHNLLE